MKRIKSYASLSLSSHCRIVERNTRFLEIIGRLVWVFDKPMEP